MEKGDQRKEDKEVLKRRKILEEPFKKVALEFVVTTLIVAVLLYLGLLLISHTAGFRSLIAERLSEEVGGSFEVGRSHLDFKLNLHAGDIRSVGDPKETGRVDIDSLSAYWSVAGLLSKDQPLIKKIAVDGVSVLAIHTGSKTGWQPEVFQFLENVGGFASASGAASGTTEKPKGPAVYEGESGAEAVHALADEQASAAEKVQEAPEKLRSMVEVRDSQFNVIGPGGQRLANFGNLSFNYVPGFNAGLEVQLYELSGDYVLQNTRIPRQKIDVEVLHAEDQIVVRKLRAGAQMLMRLSKAFSEHADVDEQAMAVLPPPEIPKPVAVKPVPEPVVAQAPAVPAVAPAVPAVARIPQPPPNAPEVILDPLQPKEVAGKEGGAELGEAPPIFIPGGSKPADRTEEGASSPRPKKVVRSENPEAVSRPAPRPQLPPSNKMGPDGDEVVPVRDPLRTMPKVVRQSNKPVFIPSPVMVQKVPAAPSEAVVGSENPGSDRKPEHSRAKPPDVKSAAPPPVQQPAPPPSDSGAPAETADVPSVKPVADLPAPMVKPLSAAPTIISETVVERAPAAPQVKRFEGKKTDENVVNEIERVLKEALDVRENAQRQREIALQKFADITNDFVAISNEIEQVIGAEEALPPPAER